MLLRVSDFHFPISVLPFSIFQFPFSDLVAFTGSTRQLRLNSDSTQTQLRLNSDSTQTQLRLNSDSTQPRGIYRLGGRPTVHMCSCTYNYSYIVRLAIYGLGLGLGNGKQTLENGNRKREVAWHLSGHGTLECSC